MQNYFPVLGKITFKSNALQYCDAFCYFCITFSHLFWACLFILNIKKLFFS